MARLILLALIGLAGCARRGPPPPGPRRPARRAGAAARPSCRAGCPDALDAARFPDATSFDDATWQAFLRAIGDTFTFTSVQSAPLPATSPMTPVFVSSEVVSEGRAENRWLRRTISLPSPPVAGVPAEVVLVVDTVRVDRRIGTGGLPPSAGVSAARVARAILVGPSVPMRGSRVVAPFALYRAGTDAPLMPGELAGIGPDGVAPSGAWARSIRFFAESLAARGRVETR